MQPQEYGHPHFMEPSDDIHKRYINMRSACMTTVMTFSQNYNYNNEDNDDVIMSSELYSSRIFFLSLNRLVMFKKLKFFRGSNGR